MRRMIIFAAALLLICSACGSQVNVVEETYTRQVGLTFCSCHDGSKEGANPRALAIFNLDQKGWIKGLSEELLDAFIERNKKGTSEDTQALSRELVAAERQRRKDETH